MKAADPTGNLPATGANGIQIGALASIAGKRSSTPRKPSWRPPDVRFVELPGLNDNYGRMSGGLPQFKAAGAPDHLTQSHGAASRATLDTVATLTGASEIVAGARSRTRPLCRQAWRAVCYIALYWWQCWRWRLCACIFAALAEQHSARCQSDGRPNNGRDKQSRRA